MLNAIMAIRADFLAMIFATRAVAILPGRHGPVAKERRVLFKIAILTPVLFWFLATGADKPMSAILVEGIAGHFNPPSPFVL